MKQFGLIGYPLAHSFSKKYYDAKIEQAGISDCSYFLFSIPSVDEVPRLLQTYKHLQGFNVTIPHKKNIISLLDDTSYLPKGLDACNCIQIRDGKLIGFNTDVIGFAHSLKPLLKPEHNKALILGNGGAADAVKYVLKNLGIAFKTVGRAKVFGIDVLYDELNEQLIASHKLIINCTPVGTFPNVDDCPNIPYDAIGNNHLLYDLIYNPDETLFLKKGAANHAQVKNGYEMLVLQAEENWRIWNEQ